VIAILDMADEAPAEGPGRKLALTVLEQPLSEVLSAGAGLGDVLGKDLDLGGLLAALTRLMAREPVEMLMRHDPNVARVMPEMTRAAERLGAWTGKDGFETVRMALGKRILRELNGPRRLRPDDPVAEIDILRALAMSLTAAAGQLLPIDDVQAAFSMRSRMLLTSDFVAAYLGQGKSALEEAKALVWLAENVIGAANKRQAAHWIASVIKGLRFETEMRNSDESPASRLAKLASLQKQVRRCGLATADSDELAAFLGVMGGQIEAAARLSASLARAPAPSLQRLTLLLKLASGESAPIGPAADSARNEAIILIKSPQTRAEIAADPRNIEAVKTLVQRAGLSA
jgi:hypothetical protein